MPYLIQVYHLSTCFLLILITSISLYPSFTTAESSSSSSNDSYNGSPLPTTAIIIVAVVFVVGIATCYIRHLIVCFRGYIFGTQSGGDGAGLRRRDAPRGLDPSVIATFPTLSFSDVKLYLTAKTTPLECAICIFEFVDQDLMRLLPTCSHVFHPHCIAPWFSSHSTCPVCRANLEILPDTQITTSPESLAHVIQHQRSVDVDQSEPSNQEQIVRPHDHDHHHSDVILQIRETSDHNKISSGEHKSNSNGVGERSRKFQRSHSTGHSLVENCERFTLRLPEEVRNKLVNVKDNNLNGLSNNPLVSPRCGYRAWSVTTTNATMSVKPDQWRFTMSPPFISKSGSSPDIAGSSNNTSSSNNNNSTNNIVGMMRSPKSFFKSMKSPSKSQLNRVVRCDDHDIGERSSDKLWPNRTSQELGLEHHH